MDRTNIPGPTEKNQGSKYLFPIFEDGTTYESGSPAYDYVTNTFTIDQWNSMDEDVRWAIIHSQTPSPTSPGVGSDLSRWPQVQNKTSSALQGVVGESVGSPFSPAGPLGPVATPSPQPAPTPVPTPEGTPTSMRPNPMIESWLARRGR